MRPDDDPAVRASINACREAVDEGIPFMGASALGELLEAEEAGIISGRWRREADAMAVEALVVQRAADVEEAWRGHFEHLDRTLALGPTDTGDEAHLVFHLRSELESAARFVPNAARALERLDEGLRAELNSNRKLYERERRGRKRASLAKRLPGHWW